MIAPSKTKTTCHATCNRSKEQFGNDGVGTRTQAHTGGLIAAGAPAVKDEIRGCKVPDTAVTALIVL